MTKVEASSVAGFVVDTEPDLRVSRVLPWLLLGRCFSCFSQIGTRRVGPLGLTMQGPNCHLNCDLYLLSSFSQDVAADLALLQREGVTHVLNVATGVEIDRRGSSIVEQRVELLDIPEQTIHESKSLERGFEEGLQNT